MFERQGLHALALAVLLAALHGLLGSNALRGQYLQLTTPAWLATAIAVAVVHQCYVWFVWRAELYHHWISAAFGRRAFSLYASLFSVLLISRLLVIIALALANRDTLPVAKGVSWIVAAVLLVPVLYLFDSVRRHFTFRRAFGVDHFDPAYCRLPLVREGIFRLTPNAMYVFGFLTLWIPGLLLRSQAALWAALFSHLYIWVHYYTTELPDMRRLYGPPSVSA